MSDNQDPSVVASATADAEPTEEQGRTAPEVAPSDDTDWKKRYNDSTREVTTKLKPAIDEANYIAKVTGYPDAHELYLAIKKNEEEAIKRPEEPSTDVQPTEKEPPKEKTTPKEVEPLKKDVEMLKADQQRRTKQEVDAEFAAFYEAYPEAHEREQEVADIAKSIWRTQVGGKFKYEHLRDALQDAYFIANKEAFMEKSKLQALTEVQKTAGAAQSLLGNSSRKAAPAAKVQLTPEQHRVAQRFIDKGVFKDEEEYITHIKSKE